MNMNPFSVSNLVSWLHGISPPPESKTKVQASNSVFVLFVWLFLLLLQAVYIPSLTNNKSVRMYLDCFDGFLDVFIFSYVMRLVMNSVCR